MLATCSHTDDLFNSSPAQAPYAGNTLSVLDEGSKSYQGFDVEPDTKPESKPQAKHGKHLKSKKERRQNRKERKRNRKEARERETADKKVDPFCRLDIPNSTGTTKPANASTSSTATISSQDAEEAEWPEFPDPPLQLRADDSDWAGPEDVDNPFGFEDEDDDNPFEDALEAEASNP